MNTFRHPQNGHTVKVGFARLWVLLFGVLYFGARGMWRHAILLFLLVLPTFGLAWVYYVITAPKHVRDHYLELGWVPVTR